MNKRQMMQPGQGRGKEANRVPIPKGAGSAVVEHTGEAGYAKGRPSREEADSNMSRFDEEKKKRLGFVVREAKEAKKKHKGLLGVDDTARRTWDKCASPFGRAPRCACRQVPPSRPTHGRGSPASPAASPRGSRRAVAGSA